MRNDRSEPQFGYDESLQSRGSSRDVYPALENSPRRKRRSLIPLTLTGIAVILFGAALWITYTGHKTGPNGEPPVIEADTAPVKVKPDQPGGMSIPYQNTTVYDQLATGKQKQEAGVEHLLQPPEQPLPKPLPAPPQPVLEAPAALPAHGPNVAEAPEAPPAASSDPAALAPPTSSKIETAQPTENPSNDSSVVIPSSAKFPKTPGIILKSVPPPPVKPITNAPLSPSTTIMPTFKPAATLVPATPTILGSGFMLQLGAFHDEATANGDWQNAKTAHPAELGGLRPTVEKVTASDKTLYRLKAGPLGEAQARQNCASLKAANVVCIVVPQ